ncbi:hypothetical protein PAHAL_2G500100 [Panicum hallii]|uniref:Glycosyltransferases n=1 Tax=Panicum hallii TaxID=206008 RepID=A0A2S3H595_9POAL|nr:probable glucuronosyltransferase Os07g0694400 [Panicum hallii]PAN15592.1 hypothetical protein PAHAL_2G500100 [Panicum hallii]
MASPKHHHNKPSSTTKKKRRPLLLRRAMLHSCLCFLLGLLTGLAPSDWADAASRAANAQVFRAVRAINHTAALLQLKTRTTSTSYHHQQHQEDHHQLLVVTTTTGLSPERERRSAALTRTAHALRLVSPPVLWLVVEAAREAPPTATLLRRTGVVYRHLTFTDNFTSDAWEEERHHQRNVALGHIEQHRLRGVVFFAGLADVYDLRLLEQLRRIRTLGAWPVATVWEQERRVAIQGPLCSSSGGAAASAAWFSSSSSGAGGGFIRFTTRPTPPLTSDDSVHGFAFASDLLWDPARWDRFPTTEPDQSQDSIKFVQRLVMEDYNKTKPIPDYSNCSQVMVWRVDTTLLLF